MMGSHYTLPFYATPSVLPDPLPTTEAIVSSRDVLKEHSGRRIVRVGAHFIVKYGAGVSLTEGENMIFATEFSKIAVPDVYALYSTQGEGQEHSTNYIVMDHVPGETLESRWASLDADSKVAVSEQLRGYFDQLRGIPPPGYFGLLGRRPFDDAVFWAGNDDNPGVSGPFDSEEQLLGALVRKYHFANPGYGKAELYGRLLPLVIRGHAPTLTHGDFQRKNIMIKSDGVLVLIDWEAAGWYPAFWEYAMALFSCGWKDDWHSWVTRVLDEYPNEYAWMDMLFRELWS